jgi:hypothetical protein
VEAQNKDPNISVIRSVWRRMKKGHINVRDLQPEKDVKGGGGVTGKSKPITDRTTTTGTTAHPKKEVTIYEIRPRVDGKGCHLISDVLRFGRFWYAGPNAIANAIKFAKFSSRSRDAVIRVYNEAGDVIDRHAQSAGDFKE